MKMPLHKRLERRVAVAGVDDCWLWTGPLNEDGYGCIGVGQRALKVHRAMLQLILARQLGPSECACHKCDNPPCVNPRHLFVGSHLDNMADRNAKGRQRGTLGESSGMAKLTEKMVIDIRQRSAGGESYRVLARAFGVTHGLIGHIVRREIWRHVRGQSAGS